ncbi:hypothetical protein HZC33_01740 [Candidatus Wolfebacteria bacterium]|nr:hypothetical protein [Candidatus Wolfebacteria bacterium]
MIKFNLQLPISIFKEGKYFIAYTPVLDLSTSGKNYDQVKKRFNEVVIIFFEELIKKGTLSDVLGNLGWQKIKNQWVPPNLISQESEKIQLSVA